MSTKGIVSDLEKIKVIKEWFEPQLTSEVQNCHSLATLYTHSI